MRGVGPESFDLSMGGVLKPETAKSRQPFDQRLFVRSMLSEG
jgi:hypothetical protein